MNNDERAADPYKCPEALRQKLKEDAELLRKEWEACERHPVSLKIKRKTSLDIKLEIYSALHPDPEERKRITEMLAKHEEVQKEYQEYLAESLALAIARADKARDNL